MSTYQKITIIGFLGDDPKLVTFEDGGSVCNLSVATTEKWKDKTTKEDKQWTEWHRVVLRNKLGELANKYLKKGSKVLIEGQMRTRMWEKDGKKNYTTELQGSMMKFMSAGSGSSDAKEQSQNTQESAPSSDSQADDLPF